MAEQQLRWPLSEVVAGACAVSRPVYLPEHYCYEVGDLVRFLDGDYRGKIGIIIYKGEVWSDLLERKYPEYDVQIGSRVLRCMSGFYMERIA